MEFFQQLSSLRDKNSDEWDSFFHRRWVSGWKMLYASNLLGVPDIKQRQGHLCHIQDVWLFRVCESQNWSIREAVFYFLKALVHDSSILVPKGSCSPGIFSCFLKSLESKAIGRWKFFEDISLLIRDASSVHLLICQSSIHNFNEVVTWMLQTSILLLWFRLSNCISQRVYFPPSLTWTVQLDRFNLA